MPPNSILEMIIRQKHMAMLFGKEIVRIRLPPSWYHQLCLEVQRTRVIDHAQPPQVATVMGIRLLPHDQNTMVIDYSRDSY